MIALLRSVGESDVDPRVETLVFAPVCIVVDEVVRESSPGFAVVLTFDTDAYRSVRIRGVASTALARNVIHETPASRVTSATDGVEAWLLRWTRSVVPLGLEDRDEVRAIHTLREVRAVEQHARVRERFGELGSGAVRRVACRVLLNGPNDAYFAIISRLIRIIAVTAANERLHRTPRQLNGLRQQHNHVRPPIIIIQRVAGFSFYYCVKRARGVAIIAQSRCRP